MSRARLLLAVIVPASLLTAPTFGQVPANAPTGAAAPAGVSSRDLSRVRAEFIRVRDQMAGVQRDFDRAARANLPAVREQALTDWQRALEGLEPYVNQLSPQVPDELPFIQQYNQWIENYNAAVGPAQAGEFFLQISKQWSELTAGTEGWEQESSPLTYGSLTEAKDDDASVRSLGLPKTVKFVNAANTYLATVAARPDYGRFKNIPNVKQDRALVEAARARAYDKLARVADGILTSAGQVKLDQNSRDRLERFVDEDLTTALAGYSGQAQLQMRGRSAIYEYDKSTMGEEQAGKKSLARLTDSADKAWPQVLAKYATQPMAPVGAGRGQIVRVHDAKNLIGKQFGVSDYDFGGYVDNAPVVAKYAPGVRAAIDQTLALTNLKSLPDDATYDFVAIVRGTAQVPNIKRTPGATTAPATADPVAAATAPAVTDCVLLDIVALHAGPVAVGTDVVVTPER